MTTVLFISKMSDPEAWRVALADKIPDLDFRVWPDVGDGKDIEFALVWKAPIGFYDQLPNLRAIISLGAGVDHLFHDTNIPGNVALARIVDPMLAKMMREYVLTATLRYHRGFDLFERSQSTRTWQFSHAEPIENRMVGVLGLGALGAGVAAHLADLGFSVRGWSRSHKEIEGVESYTQNELKDFLRETEILICLLPLNRATKQILNTETLSWLPRGASLINVGRGAQLDDDALLRHLDSGHLNGATLDVFDHEPLASNHRFWKHPRILVTPHIASFTEPASAATVVAENFRRAKRGETLLNPVVLEGDL